MSKRLAIGVDLGGTNLRVALVTKDGEIIRKVKEPVSEGVIDLTIRLTKGFVNEEIAGIGLGVAGLIDREGSKVFISPNLPAVEGVSLVNSIKEKFRVPVFIENDANAAAFGEKWIGIGKEFSNFVLFTLGTGIGGGIIHDKKLLKVAAEIGHITIHADGEKCHCGNSGCLESYASARALLSNVISALESGRESILKGLFNGNFYKLTAEDIYRTALDGDILAREMLKDAGKNLGIGIANIINVMSPEAIVLAGGLTGAWDIYIQEAIREASRRSFKELFNKVKIIPSLLGDDAGVIGSAGIVFENMINRRISE
ncbi:MAG TPA: ROK family protein [Thermodesulfovibrionales bacterium]|nr:ROK family protein [Thermodesulfovibrionales bacterium]